MLNRLNTKEREHLAKVKALPCSVCDAPGRAMRTMSSRASNTPPWRCAQTATRGAFWVGTARSELGRFARWTNWTR